MRLALIFAATLALVACGPTAPPGSAGSTAPPAASSREDAIVAVAQVAANVADAAQVAPPASITAKVTIDDKAIRLAFMSFDTALTVVDGFVATGLVKPGSPTALAIRRTILTTDDALKAASAAQRAGQARSYGEALERARIALAALRSALAR